MVVNLCLPHFQTTAHCNKLCADGCDVSNLLSGDPVVRRRGLKLEYFLRPPLHVTLRFQVRVELCRVDVELWPCGMDQGSASRRLEILTGSDVSKISEHAQQAERFKLVGRCDLREETLVCFKHLNFKYQAPFSEPPPEPPAQAKQHELWSRGPQSLSSVAQLRITIPFGGAASVLGIKSLAVWGIPSRCCPPLELEMFQKAHFESLKPQPLVSLFSPLSTSSTSPRANNTPSETPLPEEFLDPLTQELMVMPMILPSGMVVDSSTLEEYQKQEATWGRLPNDPFTGVAFTKDSKPLPNPLLKSRIDGLVLQTGCMRVGSKNGQLNKPQPSKLTKLSRPSRSADLVSFRSSHAFLGDTETQQVQSPSSENTVELQDRSRISHSKFQSRTCVDSQRGILGSVAEINSIATENLRHGGKRKFQSDHLTGAHWTSTRAHPSPKMAKSDSSLIFPTETNSSQSHEQRLSDSLDQALSSALHGLPTYASQSKLELENTTGQARCASCSCAMTVYSMSSPSYSLSCGHLLCRSCLLLEHRSSSQRLSITCPTCKAFVSPSAITRVHY